MQRFYTASTNKTVAGPEGLCLIHSCMHQWYHVPCLDYKSSMRGLADLLQSKLCRMTAGLTLSQGTCCTTVAQSCDACYSGPAYSPQCCHFSPFRACPPKNDKWLVITMRIFLTQVQSASCSFLHLQDTFHGTRSVRRIHTAAWLHGVAPCDEVGFQCDSRVELAQSETSKHKHHMQPALRQVVFYNSN